MTEHRQGETRTHSVAEGGGTQVGTVRAGLTETQVKITGQQKGGKHEQEVKYRKHKGR